MMPFDELVRTGEEVIVPLWHNCSKQELWSQKKRQFLGNSTVATCDSVFSMRFAPRSHSKRDASNNRQTVGSAVFCVVRAETIIKFNFELSVSPCGGGFE
jgi:hypothetical protein